MEWEDYLNERTDSSIIENNKKKNITPSVSIKSDQWIGDLILAPKDFTGGIQYIQKGNFNTGITSTINKNLNTFSIALGYKKEFLHSLQVQSQLKHVYSHKRLSQRTLVLGSSLRMRPYRSSVDPYFLRQYVNPFRGNSVEQWFFDIEYGFNLFFDFEAKVRVPSFFIQKYF